MPLKETQMMPQKSQYPPPKESVNSLLSGMESLSIQSEKKNANLKRYEELGNKIHQTEQQLDKVNQDIAQMKESNGFVQFAP